MIEEAPASRDQSVVELRMIVQRMEGQLAKRLDAIESRLSTVGTESTKTAGARSILLSDTYKRILETIQVLAVIAGFTLTIFGLNKLQESTDLGAFNSVSSEWLKVDQYFLQNPGMRKYFYAGEPLPADSEERQKVEAAANYVLNFLDYAISTSDHIVKKYPGSVTFIQPDIWKTYVQMTYFRSPAICNFLATLPGGYTQGTRHLAEEMCPLGK
jgi:hypothetical protein